MLDNPNVNRVNLNYEDSEPLFTHKFFGFRLYGGGYISEAEPNLASAH